MAVDQTADFSKMREKMKDLGLPTLGIRRPAVGQATNTNTNNNVTAVTAVTNTRSTRAAATVITTTATPQPAAPAVEAKEGKDKPAGVGAAAVASPLKNALAGGVENSGGKRKRHKEAVLVRDTLLIHTYPRLPPSL